ncbi:MAG TPA: hypothetical protein O0X66_00130, partial [Methanocorpusculum sp.]|nr:hypothetical protein [Methanocorpusculum sp.]
AGAADFSDNAAKYTITPWYKFTDSSKAPPLYDTITQGEWKSHSYLLPTGKTRIEIALSWGNTQNTLYMVITKQDGSSYGPYYDSFDGITNGVIPLAINGNIAECQWTIYINGASVSGTQPYTLHFNAV